jgi:hypothetical protein
MSAIRGLVVGSARPATVSEGPALWRGEIVEVLSSGLVWVMIQRMAGQDPVGPINATPRGLVPGDKVIVGAVGGDVNDLLVLSLVAAQPGTAPTWSDVTGKPSLFPPAAHTHTRAQITDFPATMPPSAHTHPWAEVTGKPTEFTPAPHTHPWVEVTGKPSEFVPSAHKHTIDDLTDVTAIGKEILKAIDDGDARAVIGAGTSSLELGTTVWTAMRGNRTFAYSEITGTVPTSALPPLAVIDTFTVASQTEMLALTAQRGDMAIRTDTPLTFVLAADDPTQLVNWKQIMAAGQVTSVSGKTGTVMLAASDILSGTFDWARLPGPVYMAATGTDLNNCDTQGLWHQSANAGAAAGANYPMPLAGLLEVNVSGSFVYQRYTTYNNPAGNQLFYRGRYNSVWGPWTFVGGGVTTDWTPVAVTHASFEPYSATSLMRIRKKGGRVYLSGSLRALANGVMTSGAMNNVGVIPANCLPSPEETTVWVCQASTNDRYALQISGSNIQVGRYGPGSQVANTWLPFSVSWESATP